MKLCKNHPIDIKIRDYQYQGNFFEEKRKYEIRKNFVKHKSIIIEKIFFSVYFSLAKGFVFLMVKKLFS